MAASPGYDVQQGGGATIVFGTSALVATVIAIGPIRRTREAMNFSDIATTGYMKKIFADLGDVDAFTVRCRFKCSAAITQNPALVGATAAPETITITFPLEEAELTGATIVGSGAITAAETPELENNVVAEATYDVTFDNNGTPMAFSVGTVA